jgi:hypothetical protein
VSRRAWLAAAGSVAAFAAALFLRMNQAYGPFNLSARPGDWQVLWELLRHQQIDGRVVLEGVALGLLAAVVPWVLLRLSAGRRRR